MKVLVVFGTRPEAIKLAPVIGLLQQDAAFEVRVCVTAQHREMLDQMLAFFDIQADYDLDLMTSSQSLTDITCRVLDGVAKVIAEIRPDIVPVHGDTTTTFAASLAAFYQQVSVAHVEAGLRTGELLEPWPEEANRRLTDVITRIHLAPTEMARKNLIREGYQDGSIHVTGNTVVDALRSVTSKIDNDSALRTSLVTQFDFLEDSRNMVLVTGHRRESYIAGFESICDALSTLADRYPDVQFVYPVHLNPRVSEPVYRLLGDKENIYLIDPVDYVSFVYLMTRCHLILTDSGGVQEEAPSLDKPVLVMRDRTERHEAVESGVARLAGTHTDMIIDAVSLLLDDADEYLAMTGKGNPYGDGAAAQRIIAILKSLPAGASA